MTDDLRKLRADLSDVFDALQGEIRAEEWGNRMLTVMRDNGWPWTQDAEPEQRAEGGGPLSRAASNRLRGSRRSSAFRAVANRSRAP